MDMIDDNLDEEMDESFDDFDEDFDPDMDPDVDGDLDLDDLSEDNAGESSFKDKDDYFVGASVETAVRANPKRAQARKKAARIVEGILGDSELSKPDGQLKAWERMCEQSDTSVAKPYSLQATLGENDTISHPKFGIGFVLEVLSDTKITVLFREGKKKLVCKNATPAEA